LIVRHDGKIDVYDATCPHRGADLGVGGKLVAPRVLTCPYHGHRIALGGGGDGPYCVRQHPSLVSSGLIFALLGDVEVGKLPDMLDWLKRTHKIFPGFSKAMKVPPEMVIENAFDWAHFPPVHDVVKVEHGAPVVEDGVFTATTTIRVRPTMWQGTGAATDPGDGSLLDVPLLARAYSPNLTITAVAIGGGDHPHFVIASGVPMTDGRSIVRLSVAIPRLLDGVEPPQELADVILKFENMGLEQDRPVWENLALDIHPRYTAEDDNVRQFRSFCERFRVNGS
jgi:phenylpropionate dioxygenase-like ring-hydroxylating dioxygenase large terminal subunit